MSAPAGSQDSSSSVASLHAVAVPGSRDARFGGVARLFGRSALDRLSRARVCVVGPGGVGSWAVEALARSGIGQLTLVDLDDVCVTNVNRQLHATTGAFGQPKTAVLAQRVAAINPDCQVRAVESFFTAATAESILGSGLSYVLDAIDRHRQKALLIAECVQRGLPVITVGGAAGRRDPTRIQVLDLSLTSHDRLLAGVRHDLRRHHGFARGGKPFGVPAVCSTELQVFPARDGEVCGDRSSSADLRLDCEHGLGTAAFVTGAFGFMAAARIVDLLAREASAERDG